MRINQRNLKIFWSQTMRVSKSLTKSLVDLGTLFMMEQKRILNVLKSQRQPPEEVAMLEVEAEAEVDGQEIIMPTDRS
jgi:hypothetical protein